MDERPAEEYFLPRCYKTISKDVEHLEGLKELSLKGAIRCAIKDVLTPHISGDNEEFVRSVALYLDNILWRDFIRKTLNP